ncbi:hypothetical protein [uncultured Salipiger sp.]|uniref:hypothetical protein n=1 Tax=uncultured Salipiger sp. TaxID=499810 RepID=UPI002593D725|nr:hypothetical protein [uncultured Salipiger sp.]
MDDGNRISDIPILASAEYVIVLNEGSSGRFAVSDLGTLLAGGGLVATVAVTDGLNVRVTSLEGTVIAGGVPTAGGPVAAVATGNVIRSGEQTIDGVATSASRVLLVGQTDPAENGIYVTAAGAWSRATDMDTGAEVAKTYVFVEGGTANALKLFYTGSNVTTIDSDDIVFSEAQNGNFLLDELNAKADQSALNGLPLLNASAPAANTYASFAQDHPLHASVSDTNDTLEAVRWPLDEELAEGDVVTFLYRGTQSAGDAVRLYFYDGATRIGSPAVYPVLDGRWRTIQMTVPAAAAPDGYGATTPGIGADAAATFDLTLFAVRGDNLFAQLNSAPGLGLMAMAILDGLSETVDHRESVARDAGLAVANRSGNLLPDDGLLPGMALAGSAGAGWYSSTPEAVSFPKMAGGYYGVRLVGASLYHDFAAPAGATEVSYFMRVEARTAPNDSTTRFLLREYNASSSATDTSVYFDRKGAPFELSGTIALQPDTVSFRFFIACGSGETLDISHLCLTAGDVPLFRPTGPTSTELNARLLTLESASGLSSTPVVKTFVPLPDAGTYSPSDVGGYTCTGAALIPNGAFAGCIGNNNDGRTEETGPDSANPYEPMLVILAPDCKKKVAEIPYDFTGNSVQGIAFRTGVSPTTALVAAAGANKVWEVCLYGDGVNAPGERILGNEYTKTGSPNALAYDSAQDAMWVGLYASSTVELVDCDGTNPSRVLDTITLSAVPDHFHLDEEYNLLFYTNGANGVDGTIRCYDLTSGVDFFVCTVPYAQAIEGLVVDRANNRMIVFSDGRFHNVGTEPTLNIAVFLEMAIPTASP